MPGGPKRSPGTSILKNKVSGDLGAKREGADRGLERKRILVVEHEAEVRSAVCRRLRADGYEVFVAGDCEEAVQAVARQQPHLIILDLELPAPDGIEPCTTLRRRSQAPMITVSSRAGELEKLLAFRLGADDYLTKPFSLLELSTRVEALLRRVYRPFLGGGNGFGEARLVYPGFVIDRDFRLVEVRGSEVRLTRKEFDLLWVLASRPGYVFTKEQLLRQVWGSSYEADLASVGVMIGRLRRKIEEDPRRPEIIQTVWGTGYKFVAPGEKRQMPGDNLLVV